MEDILPGNLFFWDMRNTKMYYLWMVLISFYNEICIKRNRYFLSLNNPGKEAGINRPRFCFATLAYHCLFLKEKFMNYLFICDFVNIQIIKRYSITNYDIVKLKSTKIAKIRLII